MAEIDVEPVDEVEDPDDVGADRDAGDAGGTSHDHGAVTDPVVDETDDHVPAGVDAPEYVLYGGKGGVGKTTMAAATALASARGGVSTLVVSTDPAHSLSDAFETDVPTDPARIHEDVPLYAAEIDPEAALAGDGPFGADGSLGDLGGLGDLLGGAGGGGPFGGAGGEDGGPFGGTAGDDGPFADAADDFEDDADAPDGPMDTLLGGAMPGADEAAAMRVLLEYLEDERFDRVVVDTAPTGHTLRLLQLPEVMDTMVGRLVRFRERIQGLVDGVTGLFGGGEDDDGDDLGDLRALRERVERLRAALRDPARTDFRVVMVPEKMSVVESERLLARLGEFGVPVGTVVVNKVMEDLADVAADVEGHQYVSPSLEDCEFCQRRWDVQQAALGAAHDVFRGHDVERVPLFADEVQGTEMLEIVGACLE